jgi:hypothetical protein
MAVFEQVSASRFYAGYLHRSIVTDSGIQRHDCLTSRSAVIRWHTKSGQEFGKVDEQALWLKSRAGLYREEPQT